jgi:hypothetical protein
MSTTTTAVFCLLSITLSVVSMFMQYYFTKKYQRLKKRNEEVYEFRKWVLNNRYDLYERLPDYDAMFNDNRPIKLETYFP